MPLLEPLDFPTYDEAVGERLRHAPNHFAGGLTEFLNVSVVDVGPGWLTCQLPVTEHLLNRFGAAHGGVVSTLVDHVLGTVCLPVIPTGAWPATSEYKLNLLAPARPGPLVATATIVAFSKRTAVARIDVVNNGRSVGAAQGTVTIMPPREGFPR